MKPYPDYRDSGVPWLGRVPAHWTEKRLKYAVSLIKEKVEGPAVDLPYLGLEHIESWTARRVEPDVPLAAEGVVNLFNAGDILFGKLRPYLAKVLHAQETGCCTSEALVLRSRLVSPRYLTYFLLARGFIDVVDGSTYGTKMPRASWEFVGNLPCLLPPLPEQRAIAAFLDRETRRIDELVGKKRRLIELLAEKRAALISHAVTSGLDPAAPMKPSGIDWLGNVPRHWSVLKLKFLVDGGLVNGLFKKKQFFGSGVRLVNVFDTYREDFLVDEPTLERVEADESEMRKYAVQPGDVFFVRSSLKLEGVGNSACTLSVSEPTVFECHVVRARPKQYAILPEFLIHFLNSRPARNRLIALANQVTMATLDQDKLQSLEIPVPPPADQKAVAEHLREHARGWFAAASAIQEGITRLDEYRSALISAAVTGKIDVRDGRHSGEGRNPEGSGA